MSISIPKEALVVKTSKEDTVKEFKNPTLIETEKGESPIPSVSTNVKTYVFDPEIVPKAMTNEYRKSRIILDLQSKILKEIPSENIVSNVLAIDSVKESFKTIENAIMIALKSDNATEINQSMRSIISLSQSIVSLFTSEISEDFNNYIYDYLYEVSKNIKEVNFNK